MGEYADDCIDTGMMSCHPFGFGRPRRVTTWSDLEYKRIIRETEKAILIEMAGGAETWFPKSVCVLNNEDKIVSVMEWFLASLAGRAGDIDLGDEDCDCDEEEE